MPLVRHVPSFSPLLLCGSCTVRDEFAYKDLLQVLEGKVLRFWRQALSRHGRVCVCHRLGGWGALLGVPSLSTLAGLRGQASGAWERVLGRTGWTPSETTWPMKCTMWTPWLLADSSHSWPGPWSLHPGQSLPLLTLCSGVLGLVWSLWPRPGKDRAAGHWPCC